MRTRRKLLAVLGGASLLAACSQGVENPQAAAAKASSAPASAASNAAATVIYGAAQPGKGQWFMDNNHYTGRKFSQSSAAKIQGVPLHVAFASTPDCGGTCKYQGSLIHFYFAGTQSGTYHIINPIGQFPTRPGEMIMKIVVGTSQGSSAAYQPHSGQVEVTHDGQGWHLTSVAPITVKLDRRLSGNGGIADAPETMQLRFTDIHN